MCYKYKNSSKYKTFIILFYIIYMSEYIILCDNKNFLEINVHYTYFDDNDYKATSKKILYEIGDEISLVDGKVFVNNATKLRKNIVKLLGTEKYKYRQTYVRFVINKGIFSKYSLDYDRELKEVILNFSDDSARKQWERVEKINKVLNE